MAAASAAVTPAAALGSAAERPLLGQTQWGLVVNEVGLALFFDGFTLNGFSVNGLTVNGFTRNGLTVNGLGFGGGLARGGRFRLGGRCLRPGFAGLGGRRRFGFGGRLLGFGGRLFDFGGARLPLILFQVFEEVGDVEEGVAVEPDVYKRRLHPGQDPGDAAFVNAADQPKLFFPLNVDFDNLTLLHQRDLGLVGGGRNHHFLGHADSSLGRGVRGAPQRLAFRVFPSALVVS